jgi:hypothetical protein
MRFARRVAKVAGLMTLALVVGSAVRMYLDVQDYAQDRVVEIGASYKPYQDVAALTRDADLVVLGRVVGEGKTHLVAQPSERPRAFQPPAVSAADPAKQNLAPVESTSSASTATQFDLPVTRFRLAIERVVHGTAQSQELTITQPGGKLVTPTFPGGPQITRTVQFEHDTPLTAGERQLVFLRATGDGTYYVVGGPQGRLTIDRAERIHPVDRATPAVRGREGQQMDALLEEVVAVR